MNQLKPIIEENVIQYTLVGDYYVPTLKLPEEKRPIGKWGANASRVSADYQYGTVE